MKEMRTALAILLTFGLAVASTTLHAESDTTKNGTDSTSTTSSSDKEKDKKSSDAGTGGAEPECN